MTQFSSKNFTKNPVSLIKNFSKYLHEKKAQLDKISNYDTPQTVTVKKLLNENKSESDLFSKTFHSGFYNTASEIQKLNKCLINETNKRLDSEYNEKPKEREEFDKLLKDYNITAVLTKNDKKILDVKKAKGYKGESNRKINSCERIYAGCKEYKSFDDQYDSFHSVKVNKGLYDTITSKINERQIDKFLSMYFPTQDIKLKSKLMPEVKIFNVNRNLSNNMPTPEDYKKSTEEMKSLAEAMTVPRAYFFSYFNLICFRFISKFRNTPSSRKEAQMINYYDRSTGEKKLFIFGGTSLKKTSDLWECNITETDKPFNKKYIWNKVTTCGDKPMLRTGHTAKLYKGDTFVIYGGIIEDDSGYTYREELLQYLIPLQRFVQCNCSNKENVTWRRNHICEVIGSSMFIHGGLNNLDEVISDPWYLDLNELVWHQMSFTMASRVPKLAYHSSCQVFSVATKNDAKFALYRAINKRGIPGPIKFEGIYIFGGMTEEGKCTNALYLIQTGKVLSMVKINEILKGQGPCARCQASVNYFDKLNILIIYGGKNDLDKYRGPFMNDFFALDLENLVWIKIKTYYNELDPREEEFGISMTKRAGHCAEVVDNELIIFGGYNENSFVKTDLMVYNLDLVQCKNSMKNFFLMRKKRNLSLGITTATNREEKKKETIGRGSIPNSQLSSSQRNSAFDLQTFLQKSFKLGESKYVLLNEELFSSKDFFEKFPNKKSILLNRLNEIAGNKYYEKFFKDIEEKPGRLAIPGDKNFEYYLGDEKD
ncbi:MAG: kelch repeat-containing protein [archaeon]|nr:kelch repeat-containing protein [archaeon]